MYTLGTLVFVIFGRTSVQPWNTYWLNEKTSEINDDDKMPLLIEQDIPKPQNLNLEAIESWEQQ